MTSSRQAAPSEPASMLLTGATVLAPEPLPIGADSVAVTAGRIIGVGPADQVAAGLPAGHAVIDLQGSTLVPGFVDAHLHPLPMAFFEHHLDVADCTSLRDLFDLLAARARDTEPGGAVLAMRLDDELLDERRLPTRAELDRVGAGLPVVVLRRDGHHAIGSTAALAAAGFDHGSADPAGGYLDRDEQGALSGLCGEAASSMLMATVPIPSWGEMAAATQRWARRLVEQGITAISAICQTGDEGPAGAAGVLEAVAWSALVDTVPFDVQTILVTDDAARVTEMRATGLHDPAAGRRLDAIKIFLDGTLGGHTACLHQPYADRTGSTGMLTLPTDEVYRRMVDAHVHGFGVCIHAIGDRANHTAAELYARLLAEHPGEHRHRIEHASVLDHETIALMAELGIGAVVQPAFIASEQRWLHQRLGDRRIEHTYPFRSLLDAGVTVASSSDAPIEDTDVIAALHAAVDRCGIAPTQAVTPLEALAMATRGSSTVRGTIDELGAIVPGARADLVVLSGDPRDGWDGVEVAATIIGGRVEHDADLIATRSGR